MINTIRIHFDWDSQKKYINVDKDIETILFKVANESIGKMLIEGKTSGDLDYIDSNGNVYMGIVSIYYGISED